MKRDGSEIISELAAALAAFGIILFLLACIRDGIASLERRAAADTTMEANQGDAK